MSHVPTQSGGAWNEMTGASEPASSVVLKLSQEVIKTNRTMQISMENDLPLISLVQSVRQKPDLSIFAYKC